MVTTANIDIEPPSDPWSLFRDWFRLAQKHEPNDPNAMALATADEEGHPSVRMVLMKSYDDHGLTFFTNRQSRKGEQLATQATAAACFYWKSLLRQVRAEGIVTLLADAESDAYFASRPRGSQLGAWTSWQSQPLAARPVLEQRLRDVKKQYAGKKVPRPPYWGGYRLIPLSIEFWQDRKFRLHDRVLYTRRQAGEAWKVTRLYP